MGMPVEVLEGPLVVVEQQARRASSNAGGIDSGPPEREQLSWQSVCFPKGSVDPPKRPAGPGCRNDPGTMPFDTPLRYVMAFGFRSEPLP